MDNKIQKLLENYEIQKKDYQNFIKSDVWSRILNNSFMILMLKKLKTFFQIIFQMELQIQEFLL